MAFSRCYDHITTLASGLLRFSTSNWLQSSSLCTSTNSKGATMCVSAQLLRCHAGARRSRWGWASRRHTPSCGLLLSFLELSVKHVSQRKRRRGQEQNRKWSTANQRTPHVRLSAFTFVRREQMQPQNCSTSDSLHRSDLTDATPQNQVTIQILVKYHEYLVVKLYILDLNSQSVGCRTVLPWWAQKTKNKKQKEEVDLKATCDKDIKI